MNEQFIERFEIDLTLHENNLSVSFEVKKLNCIPSEENHNTGETPYMSGFIKWDSCSQFYFPEESVPLHFDCIQDYEAHFSLFRWLYKRCFEIMQLDPEYGGRWEDGPSFT